jgi:hypothetical protein
MSSYPFEQRPQIEHPGTLGEGNRHVLDTLTVAYQAALQLAEDGFTVEKVEIATRNPRIWIVPCRRCAALRGVATVTRGVAGGRELVMAANVRGAQVQWVESR